MSIPLQAEQEAEIAEARRQLPENLTLPNAELWRKQRAEILSKFDNRRDREFPGWRENRNHSA